MEKTEALLGAYRRQVNLPWRSDLSGAERVWMAVYPPELERRVRARLIDFESATRAEGHGWAAHDVTDAFSRWLAGQDYRDAYYAEPSLLEPALGEFLSALEAQIGVTFATVGNDPNGVVALVGVACLFPMVRVSTLLQRLAPSVPGRLLVLFPGTFERGNYRLLDAHDGWNYLATPITIPEGDPL